MSRGLLVIAFFGLGLFAATVAPVGSRGAALAQGEAGGRLVLGVPMDEFSDSNENLGPGLAGHVAYVPAPAFAVGVGATFMFYGSDSRDIDIPLVDDDIKLTTTYNALDFYFMSQLRGQVERLTGYVEGRVGGIYLWTESKLEDDDIFDDDAVGEKVNFDDIAFCYGLGGGLMFRVMDAREPDETGAGERQALHIDLKGLYMFGGEAEYLTEGDVTFDANDNPVFRVSQSRTDILHIELGVVFGF